MVLFTKEIVPSLHFGGASSAATVSEGARASENFLFAT